MKIDLSKLNIGKWLAKIPALIRRTDDSVKKVQQQDAPPAGRDAGRSEFMEPPIYQLRPLEPMTHYEAARFSSKMFATDGRVRAAINKLAFKGTQSNSNRRPFEIDVQVESNRDKEKIWETLHETFRKLNIYRRARRFGIAGVCEGEAFYRVIFDMAQQRLVGLKKIPGPRSGFEIYGPSPKPEDRGAYIQIEKSTGRIVNVFLNIEIVPFYWEMDEEMERGTPIGIAARRAFEKVTENEDHLSIARRSRSFKRLKRKLSASTTEQFTEQVNALETIRRNQGSDEPFSDVYYNQEGDVSTLDESSPSLWNINDVLHHQGVLFDAMQTPRALYAAGGKDIPNRSVMDVLYDEWISSYVAALEDMLTGESDPLGINGEGLLKLLELALNLIGKTSRFTPVNLIWPSKSRVTDDEVTALKNGYDSGQLSNTTYFSRLLAVDWESEQENIMRERKFLLDQEIEIQKMQAERDRLLQKTGTNEKTVNPNEATTPSAEDIDFDVYELFGNQRNGKNHEARIP